MDLVPGSATHSGFDEVPRFRAQLKEFGDKLASFEQTNSKESSREKNTKRLEGIKKRILYRCLQDLANGDSADGISLPENIRDALSKMLAAAELNASKKSSRGGLSNFEFMPKDLPANFHEIVSQCLASKLESAASSLIALSGECDVEGFQKRIQKMRTMRDETESLELTRCKLLLAYYEMLFDYVQTLLQYCDEYIFDRDLKLSDKAIDLSLVKMDAFILKAKILEMQVNCAIYTKDHLKKLNAIRDEQLKLRVQLEDQIMNAKLQLEAYESVGGPAFNDAVKEYGLIQKEIEDHIWMLKMINSDKDSSSAFTKAFSNPVFVCIQLRGKAITV